MRKRKQKAIRAPKIPKAPDPIMSAQPNVGELENPKARQLGMSALKNSAFGAPKNAVQKVAAFNNSTPSNSLPASNTTDAIFQPLRRIRKVTREKPFNVNSIQSYPELLAALEAEAVQITLGANIIAPDNILINHDVAINFNGYNIISEETNPGARVLDIRSGEVTLTGKGKIFAMGARSVAIRVFGAISIGMPAYTTLTIDDGISLFAPDSYGILISPNLGVAYGLTINLSGKIIARDGIGLSSHIRGREVNLPVINIRSGARITADETLGSALEAAGYANWNIGAAKLTGATGALLKSGQINFSHTEIIATGSAYTESTATRTSALEAADANLTDAKTSETEMEPDPTPANAAIRIASGTKHDLNVVVEGGSYLGEKSFAVAGDPSSLESFVIKGGDFSGALDVLHYVIEPELDIEEGSFSLHPALHLKMLKPEIVLLPEPEPEPYPKEIIEAMRPAPEQNIPEQNALQQRLPEQSSPKPAVEPAITPLQKLPLPPTYDEAECAEKIATTKALSDALAEMKNLKSSDYEVGFADLQEAIRDAEQLLSAKIITLAAIRDASAKLLAAFDNLEERDEFSLTDDELDALFYHGAVLDEIAADPKTKPQLDQKTKASTNQDAQPSLTEPTPVTPAINPVPQPLAQPSSTPTQSVATALAQPATPDLTALATIIGQISTLNPADYTPETYNILLSELARIKPLLANADQPQIDAAVQNLTLLVSRLASAYSTLNSAHAQPFAQNQTQTRLASFLVDEAVPVRNWSTGVTAIDETDPHLCLARPLPKSLRKALRFNLAPISNFFKSFSAGLRAGLDVYQKTRRIAKN